MTVLPPRLKLRARCSSRRVEFYSLSTSVFISLRIRFRRRRPRVFQMKAASKFRGLSQPETYFGKKTLKGCTTSGNVDDVVLIDVDSNDLHNIIIVDLPESLEQKLRKHHTCNIISIDDDGEENPDEIHSMDSDATTSNRCFPLSAPSPNSDDLDGEDCLFVSDEKSPLNLSKCKTNCSGQDGSGNCYDLGSGTENDSSESDCSDCEFVDGSFGSIHEQCEQGSSSESKYDICNGQSVSKNQAGASAFHSGTQHDAENRGNKQAKDSEPSCSKPNNFDVRFVRKFSNKEKGNPFADLLKKLAEETPPFFQTDGDEAETVFTEDYVFANGWGLPEKQFRSGDSSFCNNVQGAQETIKSSTLERDESHFNGAKTFSQDLDPGIMGEPCLYNRQPSFDEHFDMSMNDAQDEEASLFKSKLPADGQADPDHAATVSCGGLSHPFTCNTHFSVEQTSFEELLNLTAGKSSFPDSTLYDEGDNVVDNDRKSVYKEARNLVYEEALGISRSYETASVSGHSSSTEVKEPSLESLSDNPASDEEEVKEPSLESLSDNPASDEENDTLPGIGAGSLQEDIITDREKIKETDEFKRAIEEEWASRQRELKIQAEEAQRQRRRKRAESMRIMDMERRQKQRLEEMREMRKKDNEDMNFKEQLRSQVRSELNKLELTCSDMASLLRSLGIHVGGGFIPSPHDVQSAYKRALLRFHPDRASRTDLRQQVEAEEKFKLISRMKEKLSLA
ncbi:hypothetical protein Nepgr_028034 [Nepenthes gracilis]|uniref:J domain-containing protein n=1 Tax=Nepenthes gracilis TaxID=150966 RepID=A0AAD3Y463_NEPGR|nr:hypothetical protein Nepgr_028034 [Nepenthes gracilis]